MNAAEIQLRGEVSDINHNPALLTSLEIGKTPPVEWATAISSIHTFWQRGRFSSETLSQSQSRAWGENLILKSPFFWGGPSLQKEAFFSTSCTNVFVTGVNPNRQFFFPGCFPQEWLRMTQILGCSGLEAFNVNSSGYVVVYSVFFLFGTFAIGSYRSRFLTDLIVSDCKVVSYEGQRSLSP